MLDGELVAFNKAGDPHFPLLSRRILNLDRSVAVQFMIFDVLAADGESITAWSYARRRGHLEQLGLDGQARVTPDTFDDGHALYDAVCERGLEVSSRSGGGPAIGRGSAAGSRLRTLAIGVGRTSWQP